MEYYTVNDAAKALGISPPAVRARLHRGALQSEKIDGRVYVLLDTDQFENKDDTALEVELRSQIQLLRDQLADEKQSSRELRRIIAMQAQNQTAIEGEMRTPPEGAGEPHGQSSQASEERRSWWKRMFGR